MFGPYVVFGTQSPGYCIKTRGDEFDANDTFASLKQRQNSNNGKSSNLTGVWEFKFYDYPNDSEQKEYLSFEISKEGHLKGHIIDEENVAINSDGKYTLVKCTLDSLPNLGSIQPRRSKFQTTCNWDFLWVEGLFINDCQRKEQYEGSSSWSLLDKFP